MDTTAIVPARPGMICAIAPVPGLQELPLLQPDGTWLLVYETPGQAVEALRRAAYHRWQRTYGRMDRRQEGAA